MSRHSVIPELTDALCRDRIALAEIAAIPPRELDALYELAAQCLDAQRDIEAVQLLGGLVALFPFEARYWRAYAVARHRTLDLQGARAAYDTALVLEPGHDLIRCYRAEILIYLGLEAQALPELEALCSSGDQEARRRAAELLRLASTLTGFRPPAAPMAGDAADGGPGADEPRFVLDDARELPLAPSRLDAALEPVPRQEATLTARIFVSAAEPTVTQTAVLPRRRGRPQGVARQQPAPVAEQDDATAIIRRRDLRGGSAEAPRRPLDREPDARVTAAREPAEDAEGATAAQREITLTAVHLRRTRVALCDEPSAADGGRDRLPSEEEA